MCLNLPGQRVIALIMSQNRDRVSKFATPFCNDPLSPHKLPSHKRPQNRPSNNKGSGSIFNSIKRGQSKKDSKSDSGNISAGAMPATSGSGYYITAPNPFTSAAPPTRRPSISFLLKS